MKEPRLHLIVALVVAATLILVLGSDSSALAGAGDDSVQELGTWAIGDDPTYGSLGTADDIADRLWAVLSLYGGFATRDARYNQSCKEVHLKDPAYGGNDQYSFDKSDVGLFVGHGPTGYYDGHQSGFLHFSTYQDDDRLWVSEVRWGNYDLDWVMLSTCSFLRWWSDTTQQTRAKSMMYGAHSIMGYASTMIEFADSGTLLGNYLCGQYGPASTFKYAWFQTAEDRQPSGKTARMLYGPGCKDEYLPGFGSHGPEPSPYPQSNVSFADYVTG